MEFLKQALLWEGDSAIYSETAPVAMSIVNGVLERVQFVWWQLPSINENKVIVEVINASALS
jgi:hypothetical protein